MTRKRGGFLLLTLVGSLVGAILLAKTGHTILSVLCAMAGMFYFTFSRVD